jgi:hypothetical protein
VEHDRFVFIPELPRSPKIVKFDAIRLLLVCQARVAVDVMTWSGKSYAIRLNMLDLHLLVQFLRTSQFPRKEIVSLGDETVDLDQWTRDWVSHTISNFDYLMVLNRASGRSFRDPKRYPIMPAVLFHFDNYQSRIGTFRRIRFVMPQLAIRSLNDSFVGSDLVLPEMYVDPRAIPKDADLPVWAANRFEFVYKARTLLESHRMNLILHEWIDRVFGSKCNPQVFTTRLFLRDHPVRGTVVDRFSIEDYELNLDVSVELATLFGVKRSSAMLAVISKDGHFHLISLRWDSQSIIANPRTHNRIVESPNDTVVFASSRSIFIFSPTDSILFVVRSDGSIEQCPLFSETRLISAYGGSVLFCPDAFTISRAALPPGESETHVVCHSDQEIVAMRAHRSHQILAFATSEGLICVHDAQNGANLSTYATHKQITRIVITQIWGFVLAFSSHNVYLLSVNGEFIRSEHVPLRFAKLFSHSSSSGFDFISFVTETGDVGVFEAFYPGAPTILTKTDYPISGIIADEKHRRMIICGSNGRIRLYPYFFSIE